MKRTDGAYVIREAKAVRLLASPLRQAMIDSVVAHGPATVAELSQRLGRPADRLYYHVRLLQRAGLLVGESRDGAGRAEERFDVPGRPMTLEYDSSTPARRKAVTHVIGTALRTARSDFARAMLDGSPATAGPERELWAGRVEGALNAEEVKEFNAGLQKLLSQLGKARRGTARDKVYQFTFAFSPV